MRADLRRLAPSQAGFFLIEAMVAILIFALGILGLVAMGGTAVSSQSDAQYRTEASSLADAIAGEVALGIDRTNDASKAASLLNFAHQATPAPSTSPAPCTFAGTAVNAGAAPGVATLLSRAANLGPGLGLPLIAAIADEVELHPVPGGGSSVTMTFARHRTGDAA